jgi:hypothetical protein
MTHPHEGVRRVYLAGPVRSRCAQIVQRVRLRLGSTDDESVRFSWRLARVSGDGQAEREGDGRLAPRLAEGPISVRTYWAGARRRTMPSVPNGVPLMLPRT